LAIIMKFYGEKPKCRYEETTMGVREEN